MLGLVVSDNDGLTYAYPVRQRPLEMSPEEVNSQVSSLDGLVANDSGLFGLSFSPKFARTLTGQPGGLLWKNENYVPGHSSPHELKVLVEADKFAYSPVLQRFCVHPSGEFFGGSSAVHAKFIHAFGTYPYSEYLRMAYVGATPREKQLPEGVLLSRAFFDGLAYDPQKDYAVNLRALALLKKNGLPPETKLLLSAPRDLFEAYGIN